MGNYRGRTTLIEDFGSLEHVVEDRGLTKAGFVELIAIQIDTALADVVIAAVSGTDGVCAWTL